MCGVQRPPEPPHTTLEGEDGDDQRRVEYLPRGVGEPRLLEEQLLEDVTEVYRVLPHGTYVGRTFYVFLPSVSIPGGVNSAL